KAAGSRDGEGLLEETVSIRHLAVRLRGEAEVTEAAGHDVLTASLPADGQGLLGQTPTTADGVVVEGQELAVGHLDQRLALPHAIATAPRYLAHALELGD